MKSAAVRYTVFGMFVLLASGTYAQDFVGQQLQVRGKWTGEKIEATDVDKLASQDNPQQGRIMGQIDEINATIRVLRIGPMRVEWDNLTRFAGISLEQLVAGRAIEAKGQLVGPAHLLAGKIEPASVSPGHLQMRGTVTAGKQQLDGSIDLLVLGVPVRLPQHMLAVITRVKSLIRRPDEQRPKEQLTINLFGAPLTIGGELESEMAYRKDFRLDDAAQDDVLQLEQELQLEFFSRLTANTVLFLEGKVTYEADIYAENEVNEVEWEVQRGETWLYVGEVLQSPLSVQIGRQNFRDQRTWWWDEDLDSVRLHYDHRVLHAELAVAQELARVTTDEKRIDPEEKDVLRVLGQVMWSWARKQQVEGFFLYQEDHSSRQSIGQSVPEDQRDPSDADLLWFGMRATGRIDLGSWGEVDYWLGAAGVSGQEILLDFERVPGGGRRVAARQKQDVVGWAFDGALSWRTRLPWRPTFTLGYAVGSGDDQPTDGTDHAFRQTGLQENKGRFRGVNRFRYYGVLLDPELSNLHIWTAALGFRFWRASSVEFLYHAYRQIEPAPFLRDTRLRADPEGNRHQIGHEWDLVIGIREWARLEIELIGAAFRAGPAYGDLSDEMAYMATLNVTVNF